MREKEREKVDKKGGKEEREQEIRTKERRLFGVKREPWEVVRGERAFLFSLLREREKEGMSLVDVPPADFSFSLFFQGGFERSRESTRNESLDCSSQTGEERGKDVSARTAKEKEKK